MTYKCTKCGKPSPILFEGVAETKRVEYAHERAATRLDGEPAPLASIVASQHTVMGVCTACALQLFSKLGRTDDTAHFRVCDVEVAPEDA